VLLIFNIQTNRGLNHARVKEAAVMNYESVWYDSASVVTSFFSPSARGEASLMYLNLSLKYLIKHLSWYIEMIKCS
jgi:hypothetical protein